MEAKDWIQIVVEIVGNGIVLAIFGKLLDLKLKKAERHDELKSSVVKAFLENLIKLNEAMISVNATVQFKKIRSYNEIIKLIEESIFPQWVEVIKKYDTYEHELKVFAKEFKELENAWSDYTCQTTPSGCGEKLEVFKEKNKELIAIVSDKY